MTPPRLCVKDCGRQADQGRELCRRCYLGATATEKATDDWVALYGLADTGDTQSTDALDALELWFALPATDPPHELGEAA